MTIADAVQLIQALTCPFLVVAVLFFATLETYFKRVYPDRSDDDNN